MIDDTFQILCILLKRYVLACTRVWQATIVATKEAEEICDVHLFRRWHHQWQYLGQIELQLEPEKIDVEMKSVP